MGPEQNDETASRTIQSSVEEQESTRSRSSFTWNKFVRVFGLPCLISVAAIDPGNLEVDLQAGSTLGYTLIWMLILSSVVGWLLQTLAAHATIWSGLHIAELYARAYRNDKVMYYSVFAVAELSVIAFDIAEVVGTAFALQLLFGFSLWLGMLLSALDTLLVLYLQRTGFSKVEIFIEGLLVILSICLFYEFALSRPSFSAILQGSVVPSLGHDPKEGAILAVGLLGSVIMSHNLYLHSWLVKQRMQRNDESSADLGGEVGTDRLAAECNYASIEAGVIFIVTFLINACVLSVSASLPSDLVPNDIGLKDAGALLRRLLGTDLASKAWAIALLSSGHAATVTGTMSSQAICEGFLDIEEGRSPSAVIFGTRAIALVPALLAALAAGDAGSDRLIVLSQVILSLALPFAVIPMFRVFTHLKETTGTHPSDRKLIWAGLFAFGLLVIANLYVLVQMYQELNSDGGGIAAKVVAVISVASLVLMWKLLTGPMELSSLSDVEGGSTKMEESQRLLGDAKPRYE